MEYRCGICDIKQKNMLMCKRCKYVTCKSCIKTYLINYANITPKCPNCNLGFTIDEVQLCLGKTKFCKFLQESTKISVALEKQKIPEVLEKANLIRIQQKIATILDEYFPFDKNIKSYVYFVLNRDTLNLLNDKFLINIINAEQLKAKGFDYNVYRKIKNKQLPFYTFIDINTPTHSIIEYLRLIHKQMNSLESTNHINFCVSFGYYLSKLNNKLEALHKVYNTHDHISELIELYSKLKDPPILIDEIKKYFIVDSSMSFRNIVMSDLTSLPKESMSIVRYILPCSTNDCRGMINSKWECDLCNRKFCNKCAADTTNDKHECKESDVENLKFIMSTTKPCPNCATRIFKSEGCSQMFCVVCHSGFDYNTGTLITGEFHNPHRIAWLRDNVHENIEYVCGNVQDYHFAQCELLMSLVHRKNHIIEHTNRTCIYELNRIRNNRLLSDIRLSYVLGNITEKQLYMKLRHIETKKHKYNQLIALYVTYTDSLNDIISIIYNTYSTLNDFEKITAANNPIIKSNIDQLNVLTDNINSELKKISVMFCNCLYYKITDINNIEKYLIKTFE